jgi:hypothetical protein
MNVHHEWNQEEILLDESCTSFSAHPKGEVIIEKFPDIAR